MLAAEDAGAVLSSIDWQFVDKVVYINLAKRRDRNEQLQKQLVALGISKEKVLRFNAIEESPGYIGCVKSHIAVLLMAMKEKWNNVLILEDDVTFIHEESARVLINRLFQTLKNVKWTVAFLAAHHYRVTPFKHVNYLVRVNKAWCACAYLVQRDYYPILLENYLQSLYHLEHGGLPSRYALDVNWWSLMEKDCWLGLFPNVAYQAADYSDIEKGVVDYRELFFKPLSEVVGQE